MTFDWAYGGINASIPRNFGPECAFYLSPQRKFIETVVFSAAIIAMVQWSLKRISLPKPLPYVNQDRVGRRVLLIFMSLILGMELGFKFSSRTVIYIFNPCHITTALQVFYLCEKKFIIIMCSHYQVTLNQTFQLFLSVKNITITLNAEFDRLLFFIITLSYTSTHYR